MSISPAVNELPPLNALRAFETVARLGGVTPAANEMCVTASAVSQQLAKLEKFLGSTLFIRKGRTMLLTETGRDYLTEVSPALQAIGHATAGASRRKERETLTVAAPPSLTCSWILPRLSDFIASYPEYDIRLVDRMTMDPEDRGVDVAFEYRFDADPHFTTRPILDNETIVLASPGYAARHQIDRIEALQGLTLIDTDRRLTSWKSVLANYPWIHEQQLLSLGYSLHAFEAAAHGVGVALGNRINADVSIQAGRLCVPFELDAELLPRLPSYYLSSLPYKAQWGRVVAFTQWLEDILRSEDNSEVASSTIHPVPTIHIPSKFSAGS